MTVRGPISCTPPASIGSFAAAGVANEAPAEHTTSATASISGKEWNDLPAPCPRLATTPPVMNRNSTEPRLSSPRKGVNRLLAEPWKSVASGSRGGPGRPGVPADRLSKSRNGTLVPSGSPGPSRRVSESCQSAAALFRMAQRLGSKPCPRGAGRGRASSQSHRCRHRAG